MQVILNLEEHGLSTLSQSILYERDKLPYLELHYGSFCLKFLNECMKLMEVYSLPNNFGCKDLPNVFVATSCDKLNQIARDV